MKLFFCYLLTIIIGVATFLVINHYGLMQFGGSLIEVKANHYFQISQFAQFLVSLITVILVARAFGFVFKKLGQPSVMGEVVGGIILGPSLFGQLMPQLMSSLIPPTVLPYLSIISQMGVVIYMFLVGLELDLKDLKKSSHSTFIISHSSILFPFVFGSLLAFFLYKDLAPAGIGFTNFALFIGVSLSITAFPVLARILVDNGMNKTSIGKLALACAAIDDITAWCLLALIVSLVQSNLNSLYVTYSLSLLFVVFMIFILKPLIEKWILKLSNQNEFNSLKISFFLIGILICAFITEAIGIHAIFGSFLFGLIVPSESFVAKDLDSKLQDFVRILLLPAFFAFTGMKTQIGLLNSLEDWIVCCLIILIAIFGKFGTTLISSRLLKYSWKDSIILGALMNTRGLVELIVLNIGLELGILSVKLFTMLVIMALVTTFMTGPILNYMRRFNS